MTDKLGTKRVSYLVLFILSLMTGCGGGGPSSDSGDGARTAQTVGGGGVKGPLVNADVSVYTLDTSQSDFKGAAVATATTNARAAISGLALPFPLNPPYILEFTSNGATTDLTTGQFPVIPTLRTVITHDMLAAGERFYATPLTTMAVDLAIAKADSGDAPYTGNDDGDVSIAEFLAALPVAASQVASTVGFGLDASIDILATPPIIDDTTDTFAEQGAVAAYRAAVEALSAVVFEIHQQGLGNSPEAVLNELSADLADGAIDGEINGLYSAVITPQALAVLTSDPSSLPIPNSDDGYGNPIIVGEVTRLLSEETSETGSLVDTSSLSDGTIVLSLQPATTHPDIDSRGTPNADDALPSKPVESAGPDSDEIGNDEDDDVGNDGVPVDSDPNGPNESDDTNDDTDTSKASSLFLSLTPEGDDPDLLEDRSVSGSIYVFVSSERDITEVRFYLDDTFVRTERRVPYSFNGDSKGLLKPFDTTQLPVGAHVISAEIVFRNGEMEVLTAIFTVENSNVAPIDPAPQDPNGSGDSDSENSSHGSGSGENDQQNDARDDDGDGINNIDEIKAGTDPNDANSFPGIIFEKDFIVAFIGDQGLGEDARAVLEMIKHQGADMVLHQGDFDYHDDPDAWDAMISDILGRDFPYFASVGNHDLKAWSGYQRKLKSRLSRIDGADCSGDLGVKSACTYKGLFFILSGVGTKGSGHEVYIKNQLDQTNAIWRICTWHKNQRLMQVGSKPDEVGWRAYEICREGGAIIATGHEHSYSRTHLLDNFRTQSIASTSNSLKIEKGKSFAFVSGLGGHSIRRQKLDGPWWASVWASNHGASHGALFCTFNPDGVTRRASCYFMDITGAVPDQFEVVNKIENR